MPISTDQLRIKGTWNTMAKMEDNISELGHEITSRAVRDRSTDEGSTELTENESLLEELIDIEDETDQQMESENVARNQRMESTEETSESGGPVEKRRKKISGMMEWLQERIELEKVEKELNRLRKESIWKHKRCDM